MSFAIGMTPYDCEVDVNVKPIDIYSTFGLLNKPETFYYNTTYQAKYKNESNANIITRAIRLHHCYMLPYFNLPTWSYDNDYKTLTFSVPGKEAPFDWYLQIFYSIEGVEGEQLARLLISHYKDSIE